MKWLTRINLALLCLLAVSTGMVKLFQMPAEMALFARIGFADWMTIGFGLVQIGAGLALLNQRARMLYERFGFAQAVYAADQGSDGGSIYLMKSLH